MANEESTIQHTTHKRDLDEMSKAHRDKIERWDAHLPKLGTSSKNPAQHVWAQSPRFAGRGDGAYWLLVKVAPRDYRIGAYDTSDAKRISFEADQQFESPKAALEAFKAYRQKAKDERDADRKAKKAAKAKESKATPKAKATTKAKAKTTSKKRVAKPKSA